jgi:hypothetical protein
MMHGLKDIILSQRILGANRRSPHIHLLIFFRRHLLAHCYLPALAAYAVACWVAAYAVVPFEAAPYAGAVAVAVPADNAVVAVERDSVAAVRAACSVAASYCGQDYSEAAAVDDYSAGTHFLANRSSRVSQAACNSHYVADGCSAAEQVPVAAYHSSAAGYSVVQGLVSAARGPVVLPGLDFQIVDSGCYHLVGVSHLH